MVEQESEKLGFREWTDHYEKEQEEQRSQIGELTKNVSSVTADVRTLIENQRGMFNRMNKPQGALIVAGFAILLSLAGLMATFISLTVGPIKASTVHLERTIELDENRQLGIHTQLDLDLTRTMIKVARQEEAMEWMKLLEERYNTRIHAALGHEEP